MNSFGFFLSLGVGLGNFLCAHYLRSMSWSNSALYGLGAFVVNLILVAILIKLGFLKN